MSKGCCGNRNCFSGANVHGKQHWWSEGETPFSKEESFLLSNVANFKGWGAEYGFGRVEKNRSLPRGPAKLLTKRKPSKKDLVVMIIQLPLGFLVGKRVTRRLPKVDSGMNSRGGLLCQSTRIWHVRQVLGNLKNHFVGPEQRL